MFSISICNSSAKNRIRRHFKPCFLWFSQLEVPSSGDITISSTKSRQMARPSLCSFVLGFSSPRQNFFFNIYVTSSWVIYYLNFTVTRKVKWKLINCWLIFFFLILKLDSRDQRQSQERQESVDVSYLAILKSAFIFFSQPYNFDLLRTDAVLYFVFFFSIMKFEGSVKGGKSGWMARGNKYFINFPDLP